LLMLVQVLRRRERELEHEMERLAREKIWAQQRHASLKKELAAKWDHIDVSNLLPDLPPDVMTRKAPSKCAPNLSSKPPTTDHPDDGCSLLHQCNCRVICQLLLYCSRRNINKASGSLIVPIFFHVGS